MLADIINQYFYLDSPVIVIIFKIKGFLMSALTILSLPAAAGTQARITPHSIVEIQTLIEYLLGPLHFLMNIFKCIMENSKIKRRLLYKARFTVQTISVE